MQDYHSIRAWKKAHALAINIHRLTRTFPRTGYASLKDQLMRSAESVAFTIVEGSGAATPKEFARFLDMSIKSSSELEAQLDLGKDYGVVSHPDWRSLTDQVREIRKMTWGLRQKVLGQESSKPRDPSIPQDPSTAELPETPTNRRGPSVTGEPETDNGERGTPSPEI
jgi:four helix bundle protein